MQSSQRIPANQHIPSTQSPFVIPSFRRPLLTVLAALVLYATLTGCARNVDGTRMSFGDTWREWAARQDAAARAAVDTSE